jgi:hypothetical protein
MAKGQALEFSEVGATEVEEGAEEEPIFEFEFNMNGHPFEFNMLDVAEFLEVVQFGVTARFAASRLFKGGNM